MTMVPKEQTPPFRHIDLRIVFPDFSSELTDHIMGLEYLRRLRLAGTSPPHIFFQIKSIFHTLESLGSARIEGNRTTVIEYVDKQLENRPTDQAPIREIENMEGCLKFIDDNIKTRHVDRAFVSELHKMAVAGLSESEEGSRHPGEYRKCPVTVRASQLVPPPFVSVPGYMDELFHFIGMADAPKYDLLKIALAHHRFVWIHPFDNGNGRTVRLLTYALMVKFGFNVHLNRILNPTAVFCHDRAKYYAALSRADQGDDEGLLQWAGYMLSGLERELKKTDELTDYDYLKEKILNPAIAFSLEKNIINELEAKILSLAIEKKEIVNSDIGPIFPAKNKSDISRMIRNLLNKNYLVPTASRKRKYTINFRKNVLIRGLVHSLSKAGFLPDN